MPNIPNIFISAGESSGDLLGANLARALLQKNPTVKLTGMGGQRMSDAGVSIQFDGNKFSVVGLVEIIKQLPSMLSTLRAIKNYLAKTKPDLIILIDLPDTHFRIMKTAKKWGIPVLYYVSPQIWAWRSGRIKHIKKYVDHMAVLFSFEEKIYRDAGVPVTFVGHPLGDLVKPAMTKNDSYDFFKLDQDRPIVALFPGSRHSELANHLLVMQDSVKKMTAKKPDVQWVLVLADHFDEAMIRAQLSSDIKIIQKNKYDLLQITDAAIAVSGTVTLEIALMQVPLCIIYKTKPLTAWIARRLIRTPHIGLCNIVAEKRVAKELTQENATSDNIADEILKILSDKNYSDGIKAEFATLKDKVSIPGKNASERVAEVGLSLVP